MVCHYLFCSLLTNILLKKPNDLIGVDRDKGHNIGFFSFKMTFTANAKTTGVPDFGVIHIDPVETAKAFQTYLNTASKLTGVALDDISTTVITMPADPANVTLADLLKLGMKLFDAIVWITAGRPKSHPLQADPGMTKESISSLHDIARAVFYCYFMLLTQARYPVGRNTSDKPKIPNFLKTIMGMDKEQHHYVEMICSFEPQKFDPAWVKFVSFKDFGQETLSRFGLGLAGKRMFGPFSIYQPRPDIDENLLKAFRFARTVAKAPASWAVHPLTRDPNILTARGNLNKNLANLALEVFTKEDLEEMVKTRVLYAMPVHDPAHRQYLLWDAEDDITGSSFIFGSE